MPPKKKKQENEVIPDSSVNAGLNFDKIEEKQGREDAGPTETMHLDYDAVPDEEVEVEIDLEGVNVLLGEQNQDDVIDSPISEEQPKPKAQPKPQSNPNPKKKDSLSDISNGDLLFDPENPSNDQKLDPDPKQMKQEVKNDGAQAPKVEEPPRELEKDEYLIMFMDKLNTFNSMYKTDVDGKKFIFGVSDAWELMQKQDPAEQKKGKAMIKDLFKDTLSQAFKAEKDAAYSEHRLPDYNEILLSTNMLMRVAMFGYTPIYTHSKGKELFEATAFGGMNAREIAALTEGKSNWSLNQTSDEAWKIQSQAAKDLAQTWLSGDKPYEKLVQEMNALAAQGKDGFADTDRRETINKLAAAEWMLLQNDKMMVTNDYDPLGKVPNWGNRYWQSIVQAREALGIPKHISMRTLIQGDYAESAKAVENKNYHERQVDERVLDPELRDTYDAMRDQATEFKIQLAAIKPTLQNVEKMDDKGPDASQMTENRVNFVVSSLDERKNLLNADHVSQFIPDQQISKSKESQLI